MSFIWPGLLVTLLLIPLLAWVYLSRLREKRTAADDLQTFGARNEDVDRFSRVRRHLAPSVMGLGLCLLLIALARPEMTMALPRTEGTLVLAFDVSNSMTAGDVEPNRLEAAKAAARVLVENQPPTVRVGVVSFGGSGLIVHAPGDDQAEALDAIERLAPQGGTSLGEGMFVSLNAIAGEALALEEATGEDGAEALRIDDYSSAVMMLFTDGENTDVPDPLEIAQIAAEAGVRVYPVGVGTTEGDTIEVEGFNILTRLNEPLLMEIADVTNGEYYRIDNDQQVQAIYNQVDLQLTTRSQEMEITALVAGLSALLLLTGGALSLFWYGRVP